MATNQPKALVHEVEAQEDHKIATATADGIILRATNIIDALGA